MEYQYFVSYAMKDGFGRCNIFRNKPIQNFKDLAQVEHIISKENNYKAIVILNFQQLPFKEDETE